MICVGSINPSKVDAVREVVKTYPLFAEHEVIGKAFPSGVSDQPQTLSETQLGAKIRAERAYFDHNNKYVLGFGIESGLMIVPLSKTGVMNVCACAVYDGHDYHYGLSSGFEYPQQVITLVKKEGLEINDALKDLGITENPKLGNTIGAVGLLTRGRVDRKEYIKQAIYLAMIPFENMELYKK